MFGSFGKNLRKIAVYIIVLIIGAAITTHGLESLAHEILSALVGFFENLVGASTKTIKL